MCDIDYLFSYIHRKISTPKSAVSDQQQEEESRLFKCDATVMVYQDAEEETRQREEETREQVEEMRQQDARTLLGYNTRKQAPRISPMNSANNSSMRLTKKARRTWMTCERSSERRYRPFSKLHFAPSLESITSQWLGVSGSCKH